MLGVSVTVRDTIPPRSQPTDVDKLFIVGTSERGRLAPILINSMADFEDEFGPRVSYGSLWDAMDVFFREGGSKAQVSRAVGPAATTAKVTLMDTAGTPVATAEVLANSPGDWAHAYDIAVVAGTGGAIKIQVLLEGTSTVVEESPEFLTKESMAEWTTSNYVKINLLGTGVLPALATATQMAGGADDRASITAAHFKTALDRFTKDLGPGQVVIPGQTDATNHQNLLDHAAANNRVALLDAQDTASAATIIAAAGVRAAYTNARYGALVGPPALAPGIVPNTTRTVPYSVVLAGQMARQTNPNQAAAGVNGQGRYVTSVKHNFTNAEYDDLNDAGVILARNMLGGVRTYGFRSLANPVTYPQWTQLTAARIIMQIKSEAEVIAEEHMFAQIDGRGIEIGAFNGELIGMLVPHYERGALYGDTPAEAFFVDTGDQVNTPTTIAQGRLRAIISVRTSPFAEAVEIEIIKYQLPTIAGTAPITAS